MLKVLFVAYPAVPALGPAFTAGWPQLLYRMMQSLTQGGWHDCRLLAGNRFRREMPDASADERVQWIDDIGLHRQIQAADEEQGISSVLEAACHRPDQLESVGCRLTEQEIRRAAGKFVPDVVICFGMEMPLLKHLWPEAVVYNVETSAFSRKPFPFAIVLDEQGLHRNSLPVTHFDEIAQRGGSDFGHSMLTDLQAAATTAFARQDPFGSCDLRRQFERLALVPLQVSSYYSFDEETRYVTQFEYLHDVLIAAPPDVGVIAAEYIQWGEVLKAEGGADNVRYLRENFPNLISLPRFRSFHSSSPYLARHCDGVWSVASNLGLQAIFFERRLGSSGHSQNGVLAHDRRLGDFFRNLGSPVSDLHRPFLAWYLERYAIPFAMVEDSAWFCDYLQRRCAASREGAAALDALVPLAPAATLESSWLQLSNDPLADTYRSRENRLLRNAAAANIAARPGFHTQPSDGVRSADQATAFHGKYILLNDTRKIDDGMHLGCNVVTDWIEREMSQMGLSCFGRANHADDCQHILESPELEQVKLVVFNGEGSLHHDSSRARELFEFTRNMKQRGVTCVLLNTVWHENSEVLGNYLSDFELVTVRESESLSAIRIWRTDARLVPDISFAAFNALRMDAVQAYDERRPKPPCMVIDSVHSDLTDILYDFAEFHRFPFYCMGRLHPQRLIESHPLGPIEVNLQVWPQMLGSLERLTQSDSCLTGRYHGAVAALTLGLPTICLPSNTPKTQGMLRDAGIIDKAMLHETWESAGNIQRWEILQRQLSDWDGATQRAAERYRIEAIEKIEQLFTDIASLIPTRRSLIPQVWNRWRALNRAG